MRLLLVEPMNKGRIETTRRLQREGYSIDVCASGEEALSFLEVSEYDAIIIGNGLADMAGLDLLTRIRLRRCTMPVLLLIARDTVEERVRGLDAGADDCLARPYATDELLARLRALIRRSSGESGSNVFTCGDLTLDIRARMVWRAGRQIVLSQKEFAVLEYMMLNQGIVLSRSQIEEHVWDYDFNGSSNVVDVYIRYLRRKLDTGFPTHLIHTVRGAGYVLKADSGEALSAPTMQAIL